MFNPSKFFNPNSAPITSVNPTNVTPPLRSGQRIIIEKSNDKNKSRWDEPFLLPPVLYQHFGVQIPQSESGKEAKSYPPKLIDFIKKAYQHCSDDSQKRTMESMLRKIISQEESKINQIQWEKYPIPVIKIQAKKSNIKIQQPIRHQKVINQNDFNISQIQQTEKTSAFSQSNPPSKSKMQALKNVQKFEEKMKKGEPKQDQRKLFIGFKNQPEPKIIAPSKIPSPSNFPNFPSKQFVDLTKKQKPQKPQNTVFGLHTPPPPPSPNYAHVLSTRPKQKKQTEIKQSDKKIIREYSQLQKRFSQFNKLKQQKINVVMESQDDYEDVQIVGKNTSMEKKYLRITGRPDPETVRPEHILKKALAFLLKKYKDGANYDYMLEQLRSLRQDLTVQHIRNKLTVRVYQENLKISLFENDQIHSQQCLSNLWQLYRQGIYDDPLVRDVFISYQLLSLIMTQKYKELEYMLTLLSAETLQHPQIKQVLKLKSAFILGNYRAFFDFYSGREEVCRCLLNQYIDKVRMKWLLMVCKTFKDKVSLKILASIISEDQDILEALIQAEGGIVRDGDFMVKESLQPISKSEYLITKGAHLSLD